MAWLRGDSLVAGFLANQKSIHKLETRFVFGMFLVDLQSFWSPLVTLFFPFVAGS
jgi:hypothetical protein